MGSFLAYGKSGVVRLLNFYPAAFFILGYFSWAEVFPHAPETIWKALTSAQLIARWLMPPTGFEAIEGNTFTYQTTPGGAWDGVIRCRVLEVVPNRRLVYAWMGGDERNTGYGAPLDMGLAIEREAIGRVFVSEDAQEGITAFKEKRKPDFKSR